MFNSFKVLFYLKGFVVFKVRKIINSVNKSNTLVMHIIKKAKELKLDSTNFMIDFEVRWNTTYKMLERFH